MKVGVVAPLCVAAFVVSACRRDAIPHRDGSADAPIAADANGGADAGGGDGAGVAADARCTRIAARPTSSGRPDGRAARTDLSLASSNGLVSGAVMEAYKQEFVEFMVRSQVLTFGDFVTKSGRKTPFFINTGRY